jgi:hypothetical protein
MMQFSYACDYYRERFKVYAGDDIFSSDDFVVEQTLKFIKAAFKSPSANQAGGCLQTNLLQNPPQDSLRTGCENKKQNKTEE